MLFFNWLADNAEKCGKDDREVVLRTMLVNFGSIHTTSIVSQFFRLYEWRFFSDHGRANAIDFHSRLVLPPFTPSIYRATQGGNSKMR